MYNGQRERERERKRMREKDFQIKKNKYHF